MTKPNITVRATLSAALLGLSFTFVNSITAAENPESSPPATTVPQERDCKKIYRLVHRGPPGKGTDTLKCVRVECPKPRA